MQSIFQAKIQIAVDKKVVERLFLQNAARSKFYTAFYLAYGWKEQRKLLTWNTISLIITFLKDGLLTNKFIFDNFVFIFRKPNEILKMFETKCAPNRKVAQSYKI